MSRQRTVATFVFFFALVLGCGQFVSSIPEPDPDRVTQLVQQVRQAETRESPQPSPGNVPRPQMRQAHTDWGLEQTAADALGRIGAKAVPALIDVLDDVDPERRSRAALILARIGPDASAAVEPLSRALGDQDARVRKAAARALGQIGPDAAAAIPTLIELLETDVP